ncbi:Basic-leucine zipper (bZIP) transcription factor family protein [Zea mays]
MSGGSGDDGQQRQCRRGVAVAADVELGAALALADMAAGSGASAVVAAQNHAAEEMTDDEETAASTRLSLRLGRVGVGVVQSPSCSSSSGAAAAHPRHIMLTEAEKEAKRLRRVLANRESARQTILRRQAVRDELARKVADLSSQNATMKKEKDVVMKEYLSLKETNEQLKAAEQAHHHHHLRLSSLF